MQPWMWLVLGLILVGVEILAPGLFLFWLGLAAGLTGLLAFVLDLSWQVEWTIFAVLALVLVGVGRELARRKGKGDQPFLNQRGKALVGREFPLAEPIINGFGACGLMTPSGACQGPDAPKGARVKVVGVDGRR